MVRKVVLAVLAFGIFSVTSNGVFAPDAQGAQWYPFYGYHRPSYLGQPYAVSTQSYVVSVQPTATQVSTAYYPPAQDTAIPALRRPRIDGFLAGRALRRYRRGVFGFMSVRGKIVQRLV